RETRAFASGNPPVGLSLPPLGDVRVYGQHLVQVHARVDAEFGEDVTQVVFDGARANEQSRADLKVREALACEFRDLGLLDGELAGVLDGAFAGSLARGQ